MRAQSIVTVTATFSFVGLASVDVVAAANSVDVTQVPEPILWAALALICPGEWKRIGRHHGILPAEEGGDD